MGIPDKNINADPFGLALGSSGITPVQMAVAFGTIANKGVYQQPLSFSRIVDSNGNVVVDMHQQQDRHQVFKPSTASLVVDMLEEAVQSGTGTKAKISSQVVAGKTDTNSDSKGVFFAGMTGWYSASVWIGHDNYKALSSKATGGNAAAPLWQSFMEKIHKAKNLDSREIIDGTPSDYNLVRVTTCGVSGQLATDACYNDVNGYKTITDYWSADSVPTAYCSMHKSRLYASARNPACWQRITARPTRWKAAASCSSRAAIRSMITSILTATPSASIWAKSPRSRAPTILRTISVRLHDAYTASRRPSELENIVSDASSLVYTAYQLVGSVAGSHQRYPSADQYRHQRGADAALPFPDRLYFAGRRGQQSAQSAASGGLDVTAFGVFHRLNPPQAETISIVPRRERLNPHAVVALHERLLP